VREYARRFPGAALLYLIGADNLTSLPQWRAAEELARCVEFVVVPRPTPTGTVSLSPTGMPPAPAGFRVRWLTGFPLGVSSSTIRARVRAGRPIDLLVPAAVAETIRNNGLYL
jgi:nicotinate-nucleotide adenylyltransferase